MSDFTPPDYSTEPQPCYSLIVLAGHKDQIGRHFQKVSVLLDDETQQVHAFDTATGTLLVTAPVAAALIIWQLRQGQGEAVPFRVW